MCLRVDVKRTIEFRKKYPPIRFWKSLNIHEMYRSTKSGGIAYTYEMRSPVKYATIWHAGLNKAYRPEPGVFDDMPQRRAISSAIHVFATKQAARNYFGLGRSDGWVSSSGPYQVFRFIVPVYAYSGDVLALGHIDGTGEKSVACSQVTLRKENYDAAIKLAKKHFNKN